MFCRSARDRTIPMPFYATAAIACGEFPVHDGRETGSNDRDFFVDGTEFSNLAGIPSHATKGGLGGASNPMAALNPP
jgi:hypothetical protein